MSPVAARPGDEFGRHHPAAHDRDPHDGQREGAQGPQGAIEQTSPIARLVGLGSRVGTPPRHRPPHPRPRELAISSPFRRSGCIAPHVHGRIAAGNQDADVPRPSVPGGQAKSAAKPVSLPCPRVLPSQGAVNWRPPVRQWVPAQARCRRGLDASAGSAGLPFVRIDDGVPVVTQVLEGTSREQPDLPVIRCGGEHQNLLHLPLWLMEAVDVDRLPCPGGKRILLGPLVVEVGSHQVGASSLIAAR